VIDIFGNLMEVMDAFSRKMHIPIRNTDPQSSSMNSQLSLALCGHDKFKIYLKMFSTWRIKKVHLFI